VYLDSIATILAGALLPWPYAVLVGVSTSLVAGILIHPAYPYYAGTQAAIAILSVLLLRMGAYKRPFTAVLSGGAIAIVAAIVSAPVTVLVFGGVTLSSTTAINAILIASGQTVWKSVIGGSLVIESIDKIAASTLAWFVLKRIPAELFKSE
jgi:energy-coupling factor transport system substrate-specific component